MIETLHLLTDALLGAGTLFVWYRARRRSEGRTGDFARVLTQTLAQASAKGYTAEFTDDAFHLYYERWNKALLEKTVEVEREQHTLITGAHHGVHLCLRGLNTSPARPATRISLMSLRPTRTTTVSR